MSWSVLLLLVALMIAPLLLGITALVLLLRWRHSRSRWVLLALLVPQSLIVALLLWPGGLRVVEFSREILLLLVTLIAWLTLLLTRWQRSHAAPLHALVTGWLLFIVFCATFWFDPGHQSTVSWTRHEKQMQHNLALLEQGARTQLDRLPDNSARELFYRAAARDYPEQTLRYFIRRGLSPLEKTEYGFTPLSKAIESHNAVAVKLFLAVLTPAEIQALSFDYDPLRDLRLDPPEGETRQRQFYNTMALLLKARPEWIHPRDRSSPSYMTTALFTGAGPTADFLLAYLPAPEGLWRLMLLALNDDTPALMAALRQQPSQLEQTISDGAGRSLFLMAWMIKYAPQQTRTALLNSKLIIWDNFRRPEGNNQQGEMSNTLIDEARGNWRFRDESPSVLQQVLISAIAQGVTLSPTQMLAVFRYEDEPETLNMMLSAGLACGPLMSASAQLLTDSAQDSKVRRWIGDACLHR
ncbi:hypothetical protein [Erwinia sorbitola]|uniref:Uncharacterized protein n=1 Tax=Erwinia sorbitola TaxID=2681984 RepID=A0ABW9R8M6_9GAMM|nr:hypothetical protein [Erwinia sorbitola]MTD26424.1 hypothetical protein [Erwinia sorbitola]